MIEFDIIYLFGTLSVFSGLTLPFYLVYRLNGDEKKPGVKWFKLAILFSGIWGASFGFSLLFKGEKLTYLFNSLYISGLFFTSLGWFLFITEYNRRKIINTPKMYFIYVIPIVVFILSMTNPEHYLIYEKGTYIDGQGVMYESYTPFMKSYLVFTSIFVFLSLGTLMSSLLTVEKQEKRIVIVILSLSTILIILSAVLSLIDYPAEYVDFTPICFFIISGVITITLDTSGYKMLKSSPFAKEKAIDEMEDIVIMSNGGNRISYTNDKINEIISKNIIDEHVECLFDELFEESINIIDGERKTVTCSKNNKTYSLNITELKYGRGERGNIIILRDISSVEKKKNELDMLKQVLSRFLRHNARNKMQVMRAKLNLSKELSKKEENKKNIEETIRKIDEFITKVNKAKKAGDIITDERKNPVNINTVIHNKTTFFENQNNFSIQTDVEPDISCQANPYISVCIKELLENAVENSKDKNPYVKVKASENTERIKIKIENNGDTIPENELLAINNNCDINQLNHGSGLGLWIAKWVIQKENGTINIENDGNITITQINIPKNT